MNILVLLKGAEKGQTPEPRGCGLITVLCQTCHHWLVLVQGKQKVNVRQKWAILLYFFLRDQHCRLYILLPLPVPLLMRRKFQAENPD